MAACHIEPDRTRRRLDEDDTAANLLYRVIQTGLRWIT